MNIDELSDARKARRDRRLAELEEAYNIVTTITSVLTAYVEDHEIDLKGANVLDWAVKRKELDENKTDYAAIFGEFRWRPGNG